MKKYIKIKCSKCGVKTTHFWNVEQVFPVTDGVIELLVRCDCCNCGYQPHKYIKIEEKEFK